MHHVEDGEPVCGGGLKLERFAARNPDKRSIFHV
jgi:hypothetical protein